MPPQNVPHPVPQPAQVPAAPAPNTFRFMDLPAELRLEVYRCLRDGMLVDPIKLQDLIYNFHMKQTRLSLLSVSKQVREESMGTYWSTVILHAAPRRRRFFSYPVEEANLPLDIERFLAFSMDGTLKCVRRLRYCIERKYRTSMWGYCYDYARMRELADLLHRHQDLFGSLREVTLCEAQGGRVRNRDLPPRNNPRYKWALWDKTSRDPSEWEATRRRFQPNSPRRTLLSDWQSVRQIHVRFLPHLVIVKRVALLFRKEFKPVPPPERPGQTPLEILQQEP